MLVPTKIYKLTCKLETLQDINGAPPLILALNASVRTLFKARILRRKNRRLVLWFTIDNKHHDALKSKALLTGSTKRKSKSMLYSTSLHARTYVLVSFCILH